MSMKALLVIDMQNDFITGALAVRGALEIIGPIAQKVEEASKGDYVIFHSKDWHPVDHMSFKPRGPWPVHCVQATWGAELHPGLAHLLHHVGSWQLLKGQDPTVEEYSAFNSHLLHHLLTMHKITEVEICGLARDYCVKETALAAMNAGYKVTILEDLCRSVGN